MVLMQSLMGETTAALHRYLQYFIGQIKYSNEAPFDGSLLEKNWSIITAYLVKKLTQKWYNKH